MDWETVRPWEQQTRAVTRRVISRTGLSRARFPGNAPPPRTPPAAGSRADQHRSARRWGGPSASPGTLPFQRQSLQMGTSGFGFPRLFPLAASTTAHRRGPHIALGDFVPPALLRRRPDFIDSTVLAAKGSILVVAALDEIRNAVAVVASQQGRCDHHCTDGTIHRSGPDLASLALGALQAAGLDFLAALLAALHYAEKSRARLLVFT